jgi:TRAP-type transport system periplasmic protein
MRTRNPLLACLTLVCALITMAALPLPGHAQMVLLKVHHFLPPTSNLHAKFLVPWTEKIAKESGGRIKFQIYPAMQLGGTAPQLIDQVRDGVVDIVWAAPGFASGRFHAIEAFELPFMTKTAQGSSRALWEYIKANRLGEREFKGMRLLATHVHDEGHLHMVKQPVQTMADLKGLKIRAGSRFPSKLLAALGATPVGMPLPQLPDALSKGVLDGALIPWEIIPTIKVHELTRYHSETDPQSRALYTLVFVLAMNGDKYAGLPADLKRIIDQNSGVETSAGLGKLWDDSAAPARKLAEQRGNQFNVITLAELEKWKKASDPVTDEWLKEVNASGFDGPALLESARALIRRHDTP